MRELTPYEIERWKQDGYFEAPEFLSYGDELGEAYDAVVDVTEKSDYLGKEVVQAAEIEVLNMYYFQLHLYTGAYGGPDQPEDLGLPTRADLIAKSKELSLDSAKMPYEVAEFSDDHRRLWDWAMEWREEHLEETRAAKETAELERRLAQIKQRDDQPSD